MNPNVIADAVADAIAAISSEIPSASDTVAVDGVRYTSNGTRRVSGTIHSAVVTSGFSDPVQDFAVSSENKTKTIIFAKCAESGWFDSTPPRDGDVFTLKSRERFAVFSVEEKSDAYYRVGVRKI